MQKDNFDNKIVFAYNQQNSMHFFFKLLPRKSTSSHKEKVFISQKEMYTCIGKIAISYAINSRQNLLASLLYIQDS